MLVLVVERIPVQSSLLAVAALVPAAVAREFAEQFDSETDFVAGNEFVGPIEHAVVAAPAVAHPILKVAVHQIENFPSNEPSQLSRERQPSVQTPPFQSTVEAAPKMLIERLLQESFRYEIHYL